MASISILKRKKQLRDGSHPIVLKVIKDRVPKIISLGFTCPDNEWNQEKHDRVEGKDIALEKVSSASSTTRIR